MAGTMLLDDAHQTSLTALTTTIGLGAPVMAPIVLSPLMMGDSRLAIIASLFGEWRPRKMVIRYQPGVGSFNNGSYMLGYSRDPTQVPVTFGASTTTITKFSLSKMFDYGTKAEFAVSKNGHLDAIRPGDWKGDEWLSCCGGDAGGIVSKLYTAGIIYGCIGSAPTGSDGTTALLGATGKLFLDWEIEFRNETNNEVARAFSAATAGADLYLTAGVTVGNPLTAQFQDSTHADAVTFGDIVVAYLSGDFVGTGYSFADNQPVWLRGIGSQQYAIHKSLYDAVHNSNPINASDTIAASQFANLGAIVPINVA